MAPARGPWSPCKSRALVSVAITARDHRACHHPGAFTAGKGRFVRHGLDHVFASRSAVCSSCGADGLLLPLAWAARGVSRQDINYRGIGATCEKPCRCKHRSTAAMLTEKDIKSTNIFRRLLASSSPAHSTVRNTIAIVSAQSHWRELLSSTAQRNEEKQHIVALHTLRSKWLRHTCFVRKQQLQTQPTNLL